MSGGEIEVLKDAMSVDGAASVDPPVEVLAKNSGSEDAVSPLVQEGMKSKSTSGSKNVLVGGAVGLSPPATTTKRRTYYSLEDCEQRVRSSYKKLKREAERRQGADSLGRRKTPPVPREETPVPNVYVPQARSAAFSAPPAGAAAMTRPRNPYEGVSFRGGEGFLGRSNRGAAAAATDPRLGYYKPLAFASGKSPTKPPAPSDPGLGYSGIAYRLPMDGDRGADPRFHIFDLDPTPSATAAKGVAVRRAATEPMTFRRPPGLDDHHESGARGRPEAARRLNFDPQQNRYQRGRGPPSLWQDDDDDDDNPNIPAMDDEDDDHAPPPNPGGSTKRKKAAKASWDDVLDRDFDAFPPRDGTSLFARATGKLLQLLGKLGVVAAKTLGFVCWWLAMAALAEYVVSHCIAPDLYGPGSSSPASSPVVSDVVQHVVAPWFPYLQRYSSSSSNESVLTSHQVSPFLTEPFPEFGPLPRSDLHPVEPAQEPPPAESQEPPPADDPQEPPPAESKEPPPADDPQAPTDEDDGNSKGENIDKNAASWLSSWLPSWLPSWSQVWSGEWLCQYTLCTAPLASPPEVDDDDKQAAKVASEKRQEASYEYRYGPYMGPRKRR